MMSPTTTRGLLGIFPRGADPPANNPRATTAHVQLPTSSSLQAILAAGARGRSARGGASGRRGPREEGRSGEGGEAESKGCSGRSNDASDAEMEGEGWIHNTLTALPWGTQESGARGLRVDARASGSDGQKPPSAMADEAGKRGRHGAWQGQGAKKGGQRGWGGISHGARTRLPTTHARLPRPSDHRHLRPYERYRRPGPRAGARGEGRAAAGARGRWG